MAGLTGRILYPGDPGWNNARKDYNERFDDQPKSVAFCQNADDVVNALKWAREKGVPLRARSGRHSYEGYSLVDGGVVIDVSDIDQVRVDREAGTATIGAGIYMLKCSEWLGEVGVTIPLATGPTVGLAGLTLGGGFGLVSRKIGLTCDLLTDVELVTADGSVIHANENEHADLFWALRGGGGGNFGIVTRMTFDVHPVKYAAAVMVEWSWDQFEKVVDQWQQWAHAVDNDLSAPLQLRVDKKIRMYGVYVPDDPQKLKNVKNLLQPLLSAVPPEKEPKIKDLPYIVAARLFFGEGDEHVAPEDPTWAVHVHSDQQIYKSTSAAAMKPFPSAAVKILKQQLEAAPELKKKPVQPSMVQLLPGGGVPSTVPVDATAVYLRDARFIVQYDGFWAADADAKKMIDWVEGFHNQLTPYTRGAYVNYVDSRLEDYLKDYYGPNLQRLVKVKAEYDPDEVFKFPQSIPTSL